MIDDGAAARHRPATGRLCPAPLEEVRASGGLGGGMDYREIIQLAGRVIDAAGVVVIVTGVAFASATFVRIELLKKTERRARAYREYREIVGKSVLLGLEFLLAGDIIRTAALSLTFGNLGTLAILVLIRSFLSVELEMEIDGFWPWRRSERSGEKGGPAGGRR